MGANFGMDDASAWGLMGYIGGVTSKVKTNAYINSVLNYTHAQLANFFDEWMDAKARSEPGNFQHMYEWPETFHEYDETVGNPEARLWKHTFSSSGGSGQASFDFLPSKRPTPVDPILLEAGPDGRAVKEGVHIFIWKAQAFEYGAELTIEPTLAKMLAYVARDNMAGGLDEGWHHRQEGEGGNINFSEGPVHTIAGGGHFTMKFSTAYVDWWQTMAQNDLENQIIPTLEQDLISEANVSKAIKLGKNSRTKNVSINAQASEDQAVFDAAMEQGIADLAAKQGDYIRRAAAARRRALYGE